MQKTVLITGTSGGFGRSVALALAQAGWAVYASMRDTAKAGSLLEDAERRGVAGHIRPVALDVTDALSIERAVASVLADTGGHLDALLNNAGYGIVGAFEDLSDADCRRQMETNFFGTLAVTRAVLPAMRQAGRGRVVVITSNAVNSPHPMMTMYAASKWALEGWAEGMAMEVAPFGVEVVVVQPGAHRTPFAQHVVPVVPANSAYARWMEAVAPGIAKLDAWGRDPASATGTLVSAVADPFVPFRTALGEDTVAFATLKGALPYEARAWLVRAILGAPAAGSFVQEAASAGATAQGTGAAVAERLGEMLRGDPSLALQWGQAFAPGSTRTG
jgi:NAD(P)-dependent dehydrogenase (short-subunit alcohol dehydrogenase family)